MAGNIVPAIATTNAIVAGLVVMELAKLCSNKFEDCATVNIMLNIHQFTVKSLEDKVLKQYLNMVTPDVEIDDNRGTIIISSEKGEIVGLDNKCLSDLNVGDEGRLNCDDFKQQLQLRLIIHHSDTLRDDEFKVLSDTNSLHATDQPTTSKNALNEDDGVRDECVLVEDCGKKRKCKESDSIDVSPKKLRVD